jgi:hypothetical protein
MPITAGISKSAHSVEEVDTRCRIAIPIAPSITSPLSSLNVPFPAKPLGRRNGTRNSERQDRRMKVRWRSDVKWSARWTRPRRRRRGCRRRLLGLLLGRRRLLLGLFLLRCLLLGLLLGRPSHACNEVRREVIREEALAHGLGKFVVLNFVPVSAVSGKQRRSGEGCG